MDLIGSSSVCNIKKTHWYTLLMRGAQAPVEQNINVAMYFVKILLKSKANKIQ